KPGQYVVIAVADEIIAPPRAGEVLDVAEYIAFRRAPVSLSGLQVDRHTHPGVAVNGGVDTIAAKKLVGPLAALKKVVAVKAEDPIVATQAEDPIVAIRCADATDPIHPDNIEVVGSIDDLSHGPWFPS